MGALCCCLSSDHHLEDYVPYQNGTLLRECPCFRCCMRWLFNSHYTSNFDDVAHQENVFPSQAVASNSGGLGGHGGQGSIGSNNSIDASMPEVFQAPPPPLPYDSDPRFMRTGRDGLISRRDKSHSSSGGNSGSDGTALQRRFSSNGDHEEQGLKSAGSEKSATVVSSKPFPRVESNLSVLDDDDVCPTCLDGYTDENPRITTACGHNFHLSCIYEWMERSNRCPLCDKEMIFNESL